MTFAELRTIVREEYLDDDTEPYRHSDAMLLRLLKEAEREACRRGSCELIADDALTLKLVAGRSAYTLEPEILKLKRVLWTSASGTVVLEKTSEDALDDFQSGWRQQSSGAPTAYFIHGRTLYLDRAPTADDIVQDATLNLQCWREPLGTDQDADDEPEINQVHHRALCYWAAHRALLRPDEDTQRQELSVINLKEFDAYFGVRVDASTLEYQLTSVGRVTYSNTAYKDHWNNQASDWLADLG